MLVGLEVLVEHHLPGLGVLHPHVLRHLALVGAEDGADFRADEVLDPVHGAGLAPDALRDLGDERVHGLGRF